MSAAVVIIAYREKPTLDEINSFKQCLQIFAGEDIRIVHPQGLNLKIYEDISKQYNVKYISFNKKWFTSIRTYSTLMQQSFFYEMFNDVDYILIHQLDVWVFRNELQMWCEQCFDYIGAPLFNDRREVLPYACNGGFSLRKVQSFIDILNKKSKFHFTWKNPMTMSALPAKTKIRSYIKKVLILTELLFCRISPRYYIKYSHHFEDISYSIAMNFIQEFKVAPQEIAMFFSFEKFPSVLYSKTNNNLPFGIHGCLKYDPEFWETHIDT